MTPQETGDVLAKAAAFDQRTVGTADVLAWHEVIGNLDLADCLEAVTVHYRESTARAMPADIRKLATAVRDRREARQRQKTGRLAVEAGTPDRSVEVKALVQAVADALPKPDVHQRALARARQERGRVVQRPLPKRKHKPPKDYPAPMSDDVAKLATRYLLDRHHPAVVAEMLGVSRRWCEKTVRRLRPPHGFPAVTVAEFDATDEYPAMPEWSFATFARTAAKEGV